MTQLTSKLLHYAALCCCLFFCFNQSYGQTQIRANGTVTDAGSGNPLTGATVKEEGGQQKATQTDMNGHFEISVPAKSKLRVTMTGYKPVVVNVKSSALMSIQLDTLAENLEEVVVVGYTQQKKQLLTGSVGVVKFSDKQAEIPTTFAGNLLAGQVAGLQVSTSRGVPGQTTPAITIRHQTSFNVQPVLYVIDGKISSTTDFNNLSPVEIDNVTVLKDAATTAAYGSRGAGGVILITTKRGKAGKPTINYTFNTGVDKLTRSLDLTSAVEAGKLYNAINTTSDPAAWGWTESDFDYFNSHDFGSGYGNGFNQLDIVFRNPFTSTHNLSVSGGSDNVQYFVGGSYVKQQGFIKGQDYDKYNIRANITANVTKNFQAFAGASLNNDITSANAWGANGYDDLYGKLLVWQPDWPVFTNTGKPISYGWIGNMGAEVEGMGGYMRYNYLKPVITLSGIYKAPFLPGLTATATFVKSYTTNRSKIFRKQYTMYNVKHHTLHQWGLNDSDIVSSTLSSTANPSYLQETDAWGEDKQLNLQLNYQHSFGLHHINAALVYERYEISGGGMNAWINGFPNYTTDQWWAANSKSGTQFVSNSNGNADTTFGRKSWVGQFFYDYANKYIASFTYRYDGSAIFSPATRWGFFPSGSVAWVISKENFFKNVKAIDFLKVRASVGLTGNDNIYPFYQWQQTYQNGSSAYFGTTPAVSPGITYGTVPNPNVTWEKSLNKNFGIDIGFLEHFNATFDYWHTYTYDILGLRIQTTPPTFPRALPATNYGKEKGQGYEATIGYTGNIGKVRFATSINAAYSYAWYTLKDQNVTYDYQNMIGDGRTTTRIVGYVVDKMLRTDADVTSYMAANPNYNLYGDLPYAGDFVYKDISGTGAAKDGQIDDNDIKVLRKNNDPITIGWNLSASWKGFSVSATFAGNLKYWKNYQYLGVEWNRTWEEWYTNSWLFNPTGGALPRRYSAAGDARYGNNLATSKFWMADASFLRLRNLNLAYNLPADWYKKTGFTGVRLYASGSNLFIISKFNKKYFDPELDNGVKFPIIKSFNFGASITF